jgi:hypothetical protein
MARVAEEIGRRSLLIGDFRWQFPGFLDEIAHLGEFGQTIEPHAFRL